MTVVESTAAPLYRVSVLGTALLRMWRAWRILVPVVIVNALLQGALLLPGLQPYLTVGFIALAVLSYLALVASYALVAAALLQAVSGPVDLREVVRVARQRFLPLLAWSVLLALVVLIGFVLYVLPGFILLALTPYLLVAVVDGARNPIATNFRVIAARWGRWLITVATSAVVCFGVWVLAALDGFFVTGAPAAVIGWLGLGLVAAWFTCAWALVYRSCVPVSR